MTEPVDLEALEKSWKQFGWKTTSSAVVTALVVELRQKRQECARLRKLLRLVTRYEFPSGGGMATTYNGRIAGQVAAALKGAP